MLKTSLLILALTLLVLSHYDSDEYDDDYDHDNDRGDKKKIADSINWCDKGIVNTPISQMSCGSCWSFVVTGMLEAKYAQLTGDIVKFSEGYLVDCLYPFSGCAGGHHADGLQRIQEIQYIPNSEDYPWKGSWSGRCLQPDSDHFRSDNALKDVWVTFHRTVPAHKSSLLEALNDGPVGVGMYVSTKFKAYYPSSDKDKDIFDDKNCLLDHIGHSMLLVGYTPNAWIMKNSYGPKWGVDGFIKMKRHGMIERCDLYKEAVTVGMIPRREIEFKLVKGLYSYNKARRACKNLSTPGHAEWTLAEVPTLMHNKQVLKLFQDAYGIKEKRNKKGKDFNYFWIGLRHADDSHPMWEDGFTPLEFMQFKHHEPTGGKIKMSKITGKWAADSPFTKMRIVCSRYVTCPKLKPRDMLNCDRLTFSNNNGNTEGTNVTVICKDGFKLQGNPVGSCSGGTWTLPSCD